MPMSRFIVVLGLGLGVLACDIITATPGADVERVESKRDGWSASTPTNDTTITRSIASRSREANPPQSRLS